VGRIASRPRTRGIAFPRRGEVYWADLSPVRGREQASLRPVLILSHDVLNERSGTVIALAITSQEQRAGFPLVHKLESGGLPRESWVKMSQVRTISVERLGQRIGAVEPRELAQVVEGLIELIA
jgi:mRNA interferase MazF